MRYCSRCVLPDTRPNLSLDEGGVCNACRSHARREAVDWGARQLAFERVVARAKEQAADRYDCLIPVSGGKDSTWQVVRCLEAGLRPLAVTWRTPGRSPLGQANLENLIRLGVDHVDYSISPRVEAAMMRAALEREGTPAIPMHLALFNIPLSTAVAFRIPLVVYGENSAAEYGSAHEEDEGHALTPEWIRRYGVTHGTTAADWVGGDLEARDLIAYAGPEGSALEAAGVRAVFLGYYFPWDPEETLAVAEARGFRRRLEGPKTGLWDYADIDCDFISIHHYLKWYKFGFTRLFDNLANEIRNGRMSREEALATISAAGEQRPAADIARFCEFTGMSLEEFDATLERFRNPEVWRRVGNRWTIPGFLVDDWDWSRDPAAGVSAPGCLLCGGTDSTSVAWLRARPAGETDYGIPEERYRRQLRRCRTCDVTSNHHDLLGPEFYRGPHNEATYGDGFVARYERVRALPADRSDNQRRVARVARYLEAAGRGGGRGRVMDVGTGLCVFLAELRDRGFGTFAVDPDPRAIAHARDRVGVDGVHLGSLQDLTTEERFDLVAFNKVLEHVPDPIGLLGAARDFLAEGGAVYLELPDAAGAAAAGGVVDREEFYVEHRTVFTPTALRFLAARAGFEAPEVVAIHEPSDKYTLYAFLRPARSAAS